MVNEPHVRLRNIYKSFITGTGKLSALEDVSFDVGYGEFLCLIGPTGCGKSTLLRIIGGLLDPTAGEVTIRGQTPADAQAEKALGFVFQEPSLLPWRTVMDNIRLPLQVNRRNNPDSSYTVGKLLQLVGLERFGHYYPAQLSGGMQQRVALARALVFEPALLLMDEPFGALDEITRTMMRYELLRIWNANKKTVVFVTHSISEAITLADRVVVLASEPGRVRDVVDIDLPRPRGRNMERGPQFVHYSELLYDLLLQEVQDEQTHA